MHLQDSDFFDPTLHSENMIWRATPLEQMESHRVVIYQLLR